MTTRQYSIRSIPPKAARILGLEVLFVAALLFMVGTVVLSMLVRESQPGFVLLLPVGLIVSSAFFGLKGLLYLFRR